jgi:ATP-dependent RNA helicase SUPV3L1/SUV3
MRALLGPTNTGKTHLALEELLTHDSGIIGFPLRLLAREGYDRLRARVGDHQVALVTGEEKIVPPKAKYFSCTVEAMPQEARPGRPFSFVAIDEIQLCADRERGHIFTDRLLHRSGTETTMVMGAETIAPVLKTLVPGVQIESRPRLSRLSHTGEAKLSRLPRRSAVVTFSIADVYAIAEEVRHHHGGAAVVTGALSPATRNAQVGLFQSGEVDILVATDAIGMGLNLDIDHVAFAALRKFDGEDLRELAEPELAQIAGRAGRHLKDGTFGTTRGISSLQRDVVERVEHSRFPSLTSLCWRNSTLDFSSLDALHASLRRAPSSPALHFGRPSSDLLALERLMHDPMLRAAVRLPRAVESFWEHCQIPDFEKTGPLEHTAIVAEVWHMTTAGRPALLEEWFAARIKDVDQVQGDLDTLVARLARVRTLAYIAHKPHWVQDAAHWQGVTTAVEERLSDALHERLTERFVDRLARFVLGATTRRGDRLAATAAPVVAPDSAARFASIDAPLSAAGSAARTGAQTLGDGVVVVGGETIGRVQGLRFVPEATTGPRARLQTTAAARGLQAAFQARIEVLVNAPLAAFEVDAQTSTIRLRLPEVDFGVVGLLVRGQSRLWPRAVAELDRAGGAFFESGVVQRRVDEKLTEAVRAWVRRCLPRVTALFDVDVAAGARAWAHALVEDLGVTSRQPIEAMAGRPDDSARGFLRRHGVRLGFVDVFTDDAFKDKAIRCRAALASTWRRGAHELVSTPSLPPSGASSFLIVERPAGFVRACGFWVLPTPEGERAFRADLVDDVAAALKLQVPGFTTPSGACERLGCSFDALAAVLSALGYQSDEQTEPRRWYRAKQRPRRGARSLAST